MAPPLAPSLRARLGSRVGRARWTLSTLTRAGLVAPISPAAYARMGLAVRRGGTHALSGVALSAARVPDAPAVVDERGSITWAELHAQADAVAAAFATMGPGGGRPTTIALLVRNHRGFVVALAAATRVGADTLLLNTGFAGPQLAEVVAREGIDVLVHDEEFEGIVAGVREAQPDARYVLAWTDAPDGPVTDRPTLDGLAHGHAGQSVARPERFGRLVLLTSGTTGTPKGAARPPGGGAGDLSAVLDRVPWRYGETVVVAAPMFHAWGFGQLVIAAVMGCTIVTRRRFDPEATLAAVDAHRATGLSVVPVMLERIVDLPDEVLDRYSCSTLRFVTASGSRMRPDAVLAFMDRFGDTVYNSYNATEAGQIATAVPADLRVAPDTAGRPVAGTEVRILDAEGREVPAGEIGQLWVRNTTQFEGYTSGDSKSFLEGFMASGDLGRLDEAGRLYVVGRDDDMIVSGGENVYPLEVEQCIDAMGTVREVVVVGVDDEAFGQRLAAYVVAVPGASLTVDDVKAHVKAELAGYKVPRHVVFLDELPRNATGKVVKRDLPSSGAAG
ncbi:AMP-binding protein [Nocardioides sp.]|uniref:AMP-binding protein n=1 Tax=Nocardioides sp. TaxID=35761 RepID=UPI0027278C03|nr:AMP-binding protein [Nocardioides sp.]MDO9457614.1 AMP-binding protein [Nocardioides sp.]